jgi:cell division protein FtsL
MGRGAAAAALRRAHPQPRTGRPAPARRRSGHAAPQPAKRAVSRTARALRPTAAPARLPVRVLDAPFARAVRARTSRLLDALLSGRGWIALVFLLLAGIVFFNVDLLQMNRDIARNSERISTLKRENARLLLDQARLANSERIQEEAAKLGLVLPAPGEVRYLKARPSVDARRAARTIPLPTEAYSPPGDTGTETDSGGSESSVGTESGAGIDPVTGFPVDPATGQPVYDPVTGAPLDPATGEPLDLSAVGTGTPADSTTTGTPTDGAATDATGATTDPAAQPVG